MRLNGIRSLYQDNFGFMNKLMLKDLNIILNQIKKNKINLPVTKKIKLYYQILVNNGFEKEDTSNLIRLLKRWYWFIFIDNIAYMFL